MEAFFVALASCLMLSAGQLQLPSGQMLQLQSLEPIRVPSLPQSQEFMSHAAHSILRQGPGTPLQPGILAGLPVLVNDAAQSVLDQESKIVGYNMPPDLARVQQKLQQVQTHPQVQQLVRQLPQQIQVQEGQDTEVERQPHLQPAQLVAASPPAPIQYLREQVLDTSAQQHVQVPHQQQPQQIFYHVQQAREEIEEDDPPPPQHLQSNNEGTVSAPPPQYQYLILNQHNIPAPPRENVAIQPQQVQQQHQLIVQSRPLQSHQHQQIPVVSKEPAPQQILLHPQQVQQQVIVQPRPIQFHQQIQAVSKEAAPQQILIQPHVQPQPQHEMASPQPLPVQYQHVAPPVQVVQVQQPPSHAPLLYLTPQIQQQIPISNNIEQPEPVVKEELPSGLQHLRVIQTPEVPPQRLLLSTPKIIPITPGDAVKNNEVDELVLRKPHPLLFHHQPQISPQSLSIPVIPELREEEERRQQISDPVRSKAFRKSPSHFEKQESSNRSSFKPQKSRPEYKDARGHEYKDARGHDSKAEASRTPIRQIINFARESEIAYMRPPPPYTQEHSRYQERPRLETIYDSRASSQTPSNSDGLRPPQPYDVQDSNRYQERPLRTETIYGSRPSSQTPSNSDGLRPPPPHTTTPSPFDSLPQGDTAIEISGLRTGAGGYSSGGGGYESTSGYAKRPVVHKHIFVHAAPSPPQEKRVRILRPQIDNPEKHVNIIFVKSPSEKSETQTVVELPPMQQPKTMVYILSKKPNENEDVRVIAPGPSKPVSPEIYFIRYGDNKGTRDYPVPNLQSLLDNSNYGPPSEPSQQNINFDLASRFKRSQSYGVHVYAPLMSYLTSGQINEITPEEAEFRRTNLDDFF